MDEFFTYAIEECQECIMDIYNAYIECGLADLEYNITYINEANQMQPVQNVQQPQEQPQQQSSGFNIGTFIQSIVSKIQELVNNFINAFQRLFQSHVSWDDYKNSETGSLQLNYDVVKVSEDINLQLAQGSKLIMKISKMTKQDPRDVQNFCDNCTNIVKRWAVPTIVGAGTVYVMSQWDKNVEKKKNFIFNKIINPVKNWSDKHIKGMSASEMAMKQQQQTAEKIKEENWKASYFAKVQAAVATIYSKGMAINNYAMQEVLKDQKRRHG